MVIIGVDMLHFLGVCFKSFSGFNCISICYNLIGRSEKGESLIDTCYREVYEEIGLDITNNKEFVPIGKLNGIVISIIVIFKSNLL